MSADIDCSAVRELSRPHASADPVAGLEHGHRFSRPYQPKRSRQSRITRPHNAKVSLDFQHAVLLLNRDRMAQESQSVDFKLHFAEAWSGGVNSSKRL